jgi:hypothetical protein
MNPSTIWFTRSIEFENKLVIRKLSFDPICKLSVVYAYYFEVCGFSFGML